jgi:hypothetical protein
MDTNRPEVRVRSGVRVLDEENVAAAIPATAARIALWLLLPRIRLLSVNVVPPREFPSLLKAIL